MLQWGKLSFCPNVQVRKISSLAVKMARLGLQAWKHRNSDNCGDASNVKFKHANFYTSTQPNTQSVNISSSVTLNDGVEIPIYGLGVYLAGSGEETRNAVLWALENGYRQIDTAARYMNEESVGEAIRQSRIPREDIFVVTKLYDTDHGYDETLAAFNKSLGKLGMEYVDLYLMHSPLPDKIVPSWNAMVKLQQQGLIRSIGVSNFGIHHLEELKQHSTVIPSVNQIEVHPFLQENDLVNYCKKMSIAVQAYSPLTRGEKLAHPTLKSIANKHSKTPAQVLLRWCIQKGYVCIPKSSQSSRIVENANIFDFNLPQEDMNTLDGLEEGFRTGKPKILEPWNG